MTRARIRALRKQGLGAAEIARLLDVNRSTVAYHLRRLDVPPDERFGRRYDWREVQSYYDDGHSITECQKRFGFARKTFMDAVARGDVITRPPEAPVDNYLVNGRRVNRTHLKRRLLGGGLKQNRCERCGITEWLGEPLSMALHHVNGDGLDNRLGNLQLLCPNCHSQTPNFSGRNRRERRIQRALRAAGAVPIDRSAWRPLPVIAA